MSGCKQKATDAQLVESYSRLKSVWKVGGEFAMGGQTVHGRLVRLGLIVPQRDITAGERAAITDFYAAGFTTGDGKLKAFAAHLGRTVNIVCRIARSLGLTNQTRKNAPEHSAAQGKRVKAHFAEHGHPRGMLGKRHTDETKVRISEAGRGREVAREVVERSLRTRLARYGSLAPNHPHGSWKAGWREVGGKRFYARSRWEANYGRYLQFLKDARCIREWEHEPKTFWFTGIRRGVCSYLPDFLVTENDGREIYHEVKGWMDQRSRTKITRMAKYHPTVTLRIIDCKWYKANSRKLSRLVPGWELPTSVFDMGRAIA